MSEPIRDYYGRAIVLEPVRLSPGPMVDLHIEGAEDFYRLSPGDAVALGEQLQEAGEAES